MWPVVSSVSAGDFLLLLCASQQWQVFSAERTEEWQHMAGVNTDRLELPLGEPNAVPNFIYCRWVWVWLACRACSGLGLTRAASAAPLCARQARRGQAGGQDKGWTLPWQQGLDPWVPPGGSGVARPLQ